MVENLANLGRSGTLWSPRASQIAKSEMAKFIAALGGAVTDYKTFQSWSASDLEGFWGALWFFAGVIGDAGDEVLSRGDENGLLGAKFFPNAHLNLGQNLLRGAPDRVAVKLIAQDGAMTSIRLKALQAQVARGVSKLRAAGVGEGDVVIAQMPNSLERLVACLACFSLGAIWTLLPEDAETGKLAHVVASIAPRLLIIDIPSGDGEAALRAKELVSKLSSLRAVLAVGAGISCGQNTEYAHWDDEVLEAPEIELSQFPFAQPAVALIADYAGPECYEVFVHSAGGMLLTHLKEHLLHGDLRRGDVLFWASPQSPMMWHWQVSALACEVVPVLYERPESEAGDKSIWDDAQRLEATQIGFDMPTMRRLMQSDVDYSQKLDLWLLRTLFLTCAQSEVGVFDWIYTHIKSNIMLAPLTGSPAIFGHYCLGSPLHPVRDGEMTACALAMSLQILNARSISVVDEEGDLICSQPFPSMPIEIEPVPTSRIAPFLNQHSGVWASGHRALRTAYDSWIVAPQYSPNDAGFLADRSAPERPRQQRKPIEY